MTEDKIIKAAWRAWKKTHGGKITFVDFEGRSRNPFFREWEFRVGVIAGYDEAQRQKQKEDAK